MDNIDPDMIDPPDVQDVQDTSDVSSDNHNFRLRTILRLFPYLNDKLKAKELKIDKESIHYISLREHAENISLIITTHLKKLNIDPKNVVITDATAGVGGNTLSFAKYFLKVNAIEIDPTRVSYLKNNIGVYNMTNVDVYHEDCLKILSTLDQHVVFIDPPWGGKSYKDYISLQLYLSGVPIEEICMCLLDPNTMKSIPDLIIIKLPINYDINHFYKILKDKIIYFHDLKKMYILVVVNKAYDGTSRLE